VAGMKMAPFREIDCVVFAWMPPNDGARLY
jgi:hypothetical protein